MLKRLLRPRGFTLVELMVVIAIIGILSSIVVTGLTGAKSSSRDAKRVSDLKSLQLALGLYYNDNLSYPKVTGVENLTALVTGGYISKLPTDPLGGNYFYAPFGATQACTGGPSKYHLGAAMENTNMPSDDLGGAISGAVTCFGYSDFYATKDCTQSGGTPDQCYDVTNN
ncbi:MAG TPA: prepilin-type N-terminal cleavage/methylation domain-containing protein [Candidatus Paceibacterota bacterium]|nr:prepilin-type N-terminal cleavage/methylation domain-containing protein [Candidatus Paceibacterota bacterium]